MPTFINDFEVFVFFQKTWITGLALAIEALAFILPVVMLWCRFRLSGNPENATTMARINDWAYHHPRRVRISQSPAWMGVFMVLVGILTLHLAVLYPSPIARSITFNEHMNVLAQTQSNSITVAEGMARLSGERRIWHQLVQMEQEFGKPIFWTPFTPWSSAAPGEDIGKSAANVVMRGQIGEGVGILLALIGLAFMWNRSTHESTGKNDHGEAAWAARSEVIQKDSGYWRLPLRVLQRGNRQFSKVGSAPLTVAQPAASTHVVHIAVIGHSGSGKGAAMGVHIFATASVPIIYFDFKGEMPAFKNRPGMLRWGFPGERPKGLPSLRFNFIAWALSHEDPDLASKTLALTLLPANSQKESDNQWIKDTAIPILAQGILSGRWQNLAELADEMEHTPLPELLANIETGRGRTFSMQGRNVPQYAALEISNNTMAYLSGRARHIVTGSDFTMEDAFQKGLYIMGQASGPYEQRVLQLLWSLFWFELLRKGEPLPLCIFIDEGVANGPIPDVLHSLVTLRDRGISLIQCYQFRSAIATVYGNDVADAVFDAHQTHIWLTKGLPDPDILALSKAMKNYTRLTKVGKDEKPEPAPLLPEDELKRHARQEKFWAIIDGVAWTSTGRPIIAALVKNYEGAWQGRARQEDYDSELSRLEYGEAWRSPFKMRLADILEQEEDGKKRRYQHWVPVFPEEAAAKGVTEAYSLIEETNLFQPKPLATRMIDPINEAIGSKPIGDMDPDDL